MASRAVRRSILIAVVLVAAAAATALWTWRSGPRQRALDPAWAAIVITLAGDGVAGIRDGDAPQARFSDPFGVAIAPDGAGICRVQLGTARRARHAISSRFVVE